MIDDRARILDRQGTRYSVLKGIYDLCDGRHNVVTTHEKLRRLTKVRGQDFDDALAYLEAEALVAFGPHVRVTHKGIVEVEKSILNPDQPTQHFIASVVQHFYAPVGSVQTGNENVAISEQSSDRPASE